MFFCIILVQSVFLFGRQLAGLGQRNSVLVFPGSSVVKNPPVSVGEAWVPFLGQEDPLEKEIATYSSILAWEIPWTEEPGVLQSMGPQRVRHD